MDNMKAGRQEYRVIGMMSGTSLDGVDLACCHFFKNESGWKFEIMEAITVEYSSEWTERLSTLHEQGAIAYAKTNDD